MNKKKSVKKLSVNRETVRELTTKETKTVAGADTYGCDSACSCYPDYQVYSCNPIPTCM